MLQNCYQDYITNDDPRVNEDLTTKIAIDWYIMTGWRNKHFFHLVTPSPWPFVLSMSLFATTVGSAMYFHLYEQGGTIALIGIVLLLATSWFWWRDVVREGTYLGYHNIKVRDGLKLGFILFVASEIMFFF